MKCFITFGVISLIIPLLELSCSGDVPWPASRITSHKKEFADLTTFMNKQGFKPLAMIQRPIIGGADPIYDDWDYQYDEGRYFGTGPFKVRVAIDKVDGVHVMIWPPAGATAVKESDQLRTIIEACIRRGVCSSKTLPPNQSLQPTADRRENLHMTPSTLKFVAAPGSVSGG